MIIKFDTKFNLADLVQYHQGENRTPIIYRIARISFDVTSDGVRVLYHVFDSSASSPRLEWYSEDELVIYKKPVIVQELPF